MAKLTSEIVVKLKIGQSVAITFTNGIEYKGKVESKSVHGHIIGITGSYTKIPDHKYKYLLGQKYYNFQVYVDGRVDVVVEDNLDDSLFALCFNGFYDIEIIKALIKEASNAT